MGVGAAPPRKILVATDLSQRAGIAVSRASQLSREHGSTLNALHVLPSEIDVGTADRARSSVEAHLGEYLDGAPVDVAIRSGTAACEIAAEAAHLKADLVVLGAHGAHWLADAFLGSTTENLVRLSSVAVLLVKKPMKAGYRTVVLAVDTSPVSADAARFASALTPAADHIVAHTCIVVGENLLRMHGAAVEQIDELYRTGTEEAREHIARLTETLPTPPKQVIITSGHPATRLVEVGRSHAADLFAVGTGARSTVSYALLGSVAQQVMRQSQADVLVVKANNT